MSKLFRNLFYLISIGLSVFFCIAIFVVSTGKQSGFISGGLVLMYVLMGLGLLAALFLAAKGMIDKPKSAVMTLIGLAVLALVVLVGYFMDDHIVEPNYAEFGISTPAMSGLVGGSLIATWIIMGIAIALTLYAAVMDFIKKM